MAAPARKVVSVAMATGEPIRDSDVTTRISRSECGDNLQTVILIHKYFVNFKVLV